MRLEGYKFIRFMRGIDKKWVALYGIKDEIKNDRRVMGEAIHKTAKHRRKSQCMKELRDLKLI